MTNYCIFILQFTTKDCNANAEHNEISVFNLGGGKASYFVSSLTVSGKTA